MAYPKDFRYTTEHEWIAAAGGEARIGITDFAQQQLGDVVFVELPKVGARLIKGQAFGTVESVKAVSEIFSPVDGEVIGINEALAPSPQLVNDDPHNAAWLIRVKLTDPSQTQSLMDAAAYEKFLNDTAASH